ncbi:MAG: hypothetical protein WKF47_13070 [Geodermatophilaceae bacterium]
MKEAARSGAEAGVVERVPDVDTLVEALDDADYLTDTGLATALFMAVRLPQPLLLEGEAGVGKTEAAKALARILDTPSSGCSATRESTRPRRSTSGTTPSSCCRSGSRSPRVSGWRRPSSSPGSTCCSGRCCAPWSTPARAQPYC